MGKTMSFIEILVRTEANHNKTTFISAHFFIVFNIFFINTHIAKLLNLKIKSETEEKTEKKK